MCFSFIACVLYKYCAKVMDLLVICKKKFQEMIGSLNFNVWFWFVF